MKFNRLARFITEDMPKTYKDLTDKFLPTLNSLIDQTQNVLTNNITTGDNLKIQKYSIDVSKSQVYPIRLNYSLNESPSIVSIASIHENPLEVSPLPVHSMTWIYTGAQLQITLIGLNSAKAYSVKIHAQV